MTGTADAGAIMDIQILLICVFIGVCLRAVLGLNTMALFGAVFIFSLVLPVFLIKLQSDPETIHSITVMFNLYVETLTRILSSVITGALLGIFTKDIIRLPKAIIDHIRGLL